MLAVIILLAVALRTYQLTARSLWFDEAFTWRLIQFPYLELIRRTGQDVHPPFYYLLLKTWAYVFGSSLVSLRAFSITAAVLLIVVVYYFTRNITRRHAIALIAAFFLAVAPWHVALSTEARMYALAAVLAAVLVWMAYRRQWLFFTFTAVALSYTHYYGLLLIVAIAVWQLGAAIAATRGRLGELFTSRFFWSAVISHTIVFVAYLPWLPVLLRQTRQVTQSFWIPPLTRWSLPETIYRMLAGVTAEPRHATLFDIWLTMLPLVGLLLLSGWLITRRPWRLAVSLLLTVTVGTFVFSIIASLFSQSIYQDRYFLLVHGFLFMLVALGFGALRPRWLSAAACLLLAVFLLLGTYRHYQRLDLAHRPGLHAAIAQLAASAQPGEPVLVGSSFIFFPVLYYQQEKFTALPSPQLYSESSNLAHFAGGPVIQPANLAGPSFFRDHPPTSFWVVDTSGFGSTALPVPVAWQAETATAWPEVFPYQGEVFLKHYKVR